MEASALTYSGGVGLHGRSPLLRLQSDERLVALIRRGNHAAFEILVARYNSRLLAFCRHMLGSREDAEDILQDVMAAAYNAILADERAINVRPWLYRIARNRSLNHLRRAQPIGMDSMDIHLHEHGMTTADKVHEREEFRLLVGDIQRLPESQRTALVLREMDALSYDQIAEAMETTIPSVKSLLVRARIGLAEASEARRLSCDEVRIELGEVAEGIQRKASPLVRRHLKTCARCATFQVHLKETSKSLALLLPVGPLFILRKLALAHLGHSAGSGAGAPATSAATATSGAAASGAAAGAGAAAGGAGSLVSAGVGALAAKAAASLAAAALVTGAAVEVDHAVQHPPLATPPTPAVGGVGATGGAGVSAPHRLAGLTKVAAKDPKASLAKANATAATATTSTTSTTATTATTATTTTPTDTTPTTGTPTTGTTSTTSVTTVLPPDGSTPGDSSDPGTTSSEGTGTTATGTTTTSGGTSPTPTTTSTTTTPTSTSPASTTSTTTTPGWPPPGGGSSGGS